MGLFAGVDDEGRYSALPELGEMSAFPIRGKRRLEQARKRNNQVWGETEKSDV